MSERYDLDRFVAAQEPVFAQALAELKAGEKRSHWIWFVFPQLKGLGASPTAAFYGVASLGEARAYLAHPVLGARLDEAVTAVLRWEGRPLRRIFGTPDDLKFRSSMTLFAAAADGGPYASAIARMCGGEPDPRTLALLGQGDAA
ncbi:DUF1810 domain-containing protein [Methylopila turkensis]|uniref:Calpastatin n=1 Tax=Methylopila turkensis TaxID=1437816 RepID=A0A9W6JK82_9HYPH|nr:DUF1810 domain-containing protein [Methylopila turkensis]GLK79201.1 calpastatin [Methylopila turkensis]